MARVLLLADENRGAVKVNPARLNVPCVRVKAKPLRAVMSIASASVTVIPEPVTVTLPMVFPTLVTVADALNAGTTDVYVPPDASVRLPAMLNEKAVTVLVLPVKTKFLK